MPYLYLFRRLPTNEAKLETLARKLGVSMFGTAVTHSGRTGTDTHEVQRRIREAVAASGCRPG